MGGSLKSVAKQQPHLDLQPSPYPLHGVVCRLGVVCLSNRPPVPPALVLAVSVVAVSAAALLVRLADGVHPVVAGFWRTAAVGLLLAPSLPSVRRKLRAGDLGLTLLAAFFLAGHFWAWFESLHHTTVLRSTLWVSLTPIWAGAAEWVLGGQRPGRRFWGGIAIAVLGVVGMATGGSSELGDGALLGDLLAALGGLLAAAYLVAGRYARQSIPIGPYGSLVSGLCGLWLLPVALVLDAPLTGFSNTAWLALLGLTLGPQLLGHIGFNYSVRYLPAYVVTAAVLLEPVGAAILGVVVLGEIPTNAEVMGAAVVLLGVGLATLSSGKKKAASRSEGHATDGSPAGAIAQSGDGGGTNAAPGEG